MSDDLYLTWGDEQERSKAYEKASDNVNAYDGVQKSFAYDYRTFIDVESKCISAGNLKPIAFCTIAIS